MNHDMGATIASYSWDQRRARRLFLVHFPLALLHLPLVFVFIGLPGFALFGYFALRSFRRWRHAGAAFEIHEHGIVDRRKSLPRHHPFSELQSCVPIDHRWRFPFPFNFLTVHNVGLTARVHNRHFVVNEHLENIRDCIARLQRGALAQRLPSARAHLAQGGELKFGHVAMTSDGLRLARRVLPWQEFGGLGSGFWQVGRRAEPALQVLMVNGTAWDVFTRAQLPDAALFIALAGERANMNTEELLRQFCMC